MRFPRPKKDMARSVLALFGAAFALAQSPATAQDVSAFEKIPGLDFVLASRGVVEKALPLVQASAATFKKKMGATCISCHHQSLSMMTMALARDRGLKFDPALANEQNEYVKGFMNRLAPLAQRAIKEPKYEYKLDTLTVNPSVTTAYSLMGMAAQSMPPDANTDAWATYLMRKQAADGRWVSIAARPPLEGSEFTTTALAIRTLQLYGPKALQQEVDERLAKAKVWLENARPRTTEDHAFRLYGLYWAKADATKIREQVQTLLEMQRDDGGWAQLPELGSDAYATGLVLTALHQAGGTPTKESAWSRGAVWLIMNQKEDGSWLVKKRIPAAQPYFDAGFPHEQSQFVSFAGTCWATMALSLNVAPPDATRTAKAR